MRTETIMRAMALTQMFAIPIGCGSSGTSVTTGGATVAGASSAGGGTSNGAGTSTGGAGGSTGSSTGGGPAELGAACTFNSNGDTCVTYDLECTAEIKWVLCEGLDYPCPPADYTFLEGGSGTCALPQEFAGCSPSIGCQDGGFGGSPGLACSRPSSAPIPAPAPWTAPTSAKAARLSTRISAAATTTAT